MKQFQQKKGIIKILYWFILSPKTKLINSKLLLGDNITCGNPKSVLYLIMYCGGYHFVFFPSCMTFLLLLFSFIHMCIQCLGHFSLLYPAPSLTYPPPPTPFGTPSPPGRNYFSLISNFVEERV
jgi:hypothetical protein